MVLRSSLRQGYDDGQFDGDRPRSHGFQGSQVGQTGRNDLGAVLPPWHMWGNTQRITTLVQSPTNPLTFSPGQLLRISYKRPETWHWVIAARMLEGDAADLVDPITVEVRFDLTIGVGRSMLQIPGGFGYFDQRNDPAFESFTFSWGGPGPGADPNFPRGAQIYSTAVFAPARDFVNGPGPTKSTAIVQEIVAQDIQLNCRVVAVTTPGSPHVGKSATIEITGHFAPKSHVRPDWFQPVPQLQYLGAEVQGK